jgi:hypothetical protein
MPYTSSAKRGGDHPGAKRKKLNSSNRYDYTNQNNFSNKGDNKNKYHFRDKRKKKKF